MIHPTQRIGRADGVRTGCAALVASALLAACGGGSSNNTAMSTTTAASSQTITKGLWIANGTNVLEYIPQQLVAGTHATVPHRTVASAAFGAPQGVSFDASGDLWVMDPQSPINGVATPALLEFSAEQLANLGSNPAPAPVAIVTSASLAFPQQSVFDGQGNQWVSDHNSNSVLVFTAAQLAQIGTQNMTPAAVITSPAFNGPLGIVFDSYGTLYIANNGGVPGANGTTSAAGTSIVAFVASHLPTPAGDGASNAVTLTPDLTFNDDGQNSIQAPWALVFDRQGDLWSSNANNPFTLVEFTPASLTMSGAPLPAVTIGPTMVGGNATLNAPNGLCFDNLGDLAAMNSAGAFGASFFNNNQLTASGGTAPNTFIVGAATTLNAPAGCNFGPVE